MTRTTRQLWSTAQVVGVVATLVLLAGLVLRPEPSLTILWKVLIPLVPASLLVSPLLWRNACPLATLDMLGDRIRSSRIAPARWASVTPALGIVLLAALVPARRVVFNTDGPVLAGVVMAVALAALALGVVFDSKTGFCNALCPVLPVERLYGQSPLIELEEARCGSCDGCTGGCLDLVPRKSAFHALGDGDRTRAWLTTPFGSFAAAFPGFVLGYFLTADGGWSSAPGVYATVALIALCSFVSVATITTAFGLSSRRVVPALAALAAGIYYWFSAEPLAAAVGMPPPSGEALRVAFLTLIAAWLWRTQTSAGAIPAR